MWICADRASPTSGRSTTGPRSAVVRKLTCPSRHSCSKTRRRTLTASRYNPSEVSAARWVSSSALRFENVAWDAVELPFAVKIFPFLKVFPQSLLESLGLFTLRFPSLPLHRLKGRAADTGPAAGAAEHLPYNLWGLTFRITEDLLKLAGTGSKDTFEARHPPCLFPQVGLGRWATSP